MSGQGEIMATAQAFILYLHGFNSSPQSYKAQAMLRHMQQAKLSSQLCIADIPPRPSDAEPYLLTLAAELNDRYQLSVVGSSLGGFYATWLAEQFDLRAVLINPAVMPHERLVEYLGENENYQTGETWTFTQEDIDTLESMVPTSIAHPEKYRVLLQTGDETLDYQQALQKYAGCPSIVEQGGSHEFSGFERYLDKILSFCNVTQT